MLPNFVTDNFGVRVDRVFRDSTAAVSEALTPLSTAYAGPLHEGDILTRIGSHPVSDPSDIPDIMRNFMPGDEILLQILRRADNDPSNGYGPMQLRAQVRQEHLFPAVHAQPNEPRRKALGIHLGSRLPLPGRVDVDSGYMVEMISRGAVTQNINIGDVITKINDIPLDNFDALAQLIYESQEGAELYVDLLVPSIGGQWISRRGTIRMQMLPISHINQYGLI